MNSMTIAPADVVAVLLADGWHRIVPGSFQVGPLGLGLGAGAGLGELGFRFEESDTGSPYRPAALVGPLGSMLAVRQVNSANGRPCELDRPAARRWTRPAAGAGAVA